MSKAAQINNDLWLKEMMINPKSNPQFENFYKEELVRFCKIAKQEINKLLEDKRKAKKYIDEEVLFEDMFSEGEDTFLEDVNTKYYKGLKELLGDKENE